MRLPIALLLAFCSLAAFAQKSTFDFDNEGWRCDGDPESTSAYWFSSGGAPGGHIRMTDASTGGTWYFIAPAKFRGPKVLMPTASSCATSNLLRFWLEVYDRWGSLVFAADDPEAIWDGRIRGKDAMMGVYVWRLEWDAEIFGARQTWRAEGDLTVVK